MDENNIKVAQGEVLFSREFLDSLYDVADKLERERLVAIATVRAKELKLEKQFTNLIKSYNNAEKELQNYYKKQAAECGEIELDYDSKGNPTATIDNFYKILTQDVFFDGLKYNTLSNCPEQVSYGNARRWTDADDANAKRYIESKYKIHNGEKYDSALRIVFAENEYHPIRDLLDTVQWDGVERIPTILSKWLGAEDTEYGQEVARLIFTGGINRLYNPGCKFDDVPVFIGTKQGEGKSTFIRWLALSDEWFNEIGEIDGQRGIEALEGAWVCEIAELIAVTRAKDVEAIKAYITRQNDKYRMPFDKRVTDHKRQCFFIGTTNKEQFLTDKTGNRRFYPIKIYTSGYEMNDVKEQVQADILQCWAEAKVKYERGEMLPYARREVQPEIKKRQASAVEDDVIDGIIDSFIENKNEVCIIQIWKNALGNEFSKPSKKESSDISLIMQSKDDWEKMPTPKRFDGFGLQRYWRKVSAYEKNIEKLEKISRDLQF